MEKIKKFFDNTDDYIKVKDLNLEKFMDLL